ncbi:hypothetical protein PMAYCL1PPCAC_22468, partial [Pristionchus mayeri]
DDKGMQSDPERNGHDKKEGIIQVQIVEAAAQGNCQIIQAWKLCSRVVREETLQPFRLKMIVGVVSPDHGLGLFIGSDKAVVPILYTANTPCPLVHRVAILPFDEKLFHS